MPATVTLLSDRPSVALPWRTTLEEHGVKLDAVSPAHIDVAAQGHRARGANGAPGCVGVVLDAGSAAYGDDELLWALGYLRASGACIAVHLIGATIDPEIEEIVDEICEGLVARSDQDVPRIVGALLRRSDPDRAQRFEFVTLAPSGHELLTILGDGRCALFPRPLSDEDDGSRIVSIDLAENAESATITLEGDLSITIIAAEIAAHGRNGSAVDVPSILLDGAGLGARLKELRLEAGLTQAELARRTGIHRPNIARVEAGRHTPSLETLSRLTVAIGVPATRVFEKG